MKRLILVPALITAAFISFAQTECSKSNPIFKSDNYGAPKEVYTLGSNPEFPFLKGLSTTQEVASAIKRSANKHGAAELNRMLIDIGFANGAKDVTASAISAYDIPAGTTGNMGDGNFNISFAKLMVGDDVKSWKISSSSGCYLYILAKCGNAFYPARQATASLDVPLNINSISREVTLEGGATTTTTGNTYVYYRRGRDRKQPLAPDYADLNSDAKASNPVLLNTTKKVEAVPQSYRVTVSSPDSRVRVYPDAPLDVTANINVEKTSEYSGYYPSRVKNHYQEVSRRVYGKSARKMRHALRKEAKIARLTQTRVNTEVAAKK